MFWLTCFGLHAGHFQGDIIIIIIIIIIIKRIQTYAFG